MTGATDHDRGDQKRPSAALNREAAASSPKRGWAAPKIRPQRDYLLFHHQARKEWLGDLGD
jgi:hypothetical protein